MKAWVIFDADNTLWDIEHLYDKARKELIDYVSKRGFSKEEVEKFQRQRDRQLVETYGYSACRFARSFEDTVVSFLGDDKNSIIHCRSIALDVFEKKAETSPGLDNLLPLIKKYFKVGIVTAGERWVQERRLSDFHLIHLIDQVTVVEEKNCEAFLQFAEQNEVYIGKSWIVGDSLKSDIIPAKRAGFKAVHYDNHNWVENEHVTGFEPDYKVSHLNELIEILGIE